MSNRYKLVQVDQAGAEALIVAMMTKPGSNLRRLITANIKAHTYFAMHLFADVWQKQLFTGSDSHIQAFLESPIELLPQLPRWKDLSLAITLSDGNPPSTRYYHHAKMGVHGGNYGIAEKRFCDQVMDKSDGDIILTLAEGARIITTLHRVLPEIRGDFQAHVKREIDSTGVLRNLFGYPCEFFHYGRPPDDNLYRAAYSYIPQSTVGIITSMCITELQELLDIGARNDFEILANTHDSVLLQAREEDVPSVIALAQEKMNRKLTSIYGETFFMKSDVTVGYNWKEMKKLEK